MSNTESEYTNTRNSTIDKRRRGNSTSIWEEILACTRVTGNANSARSTRRVK